MTEQEYKAELKKIQSDADAAKKELAIKYAKTKVKFKVGDIVKAKYGEVFRIDKISVYLMLSDPQPKYSGAVLKKDLTPRLNGMLTCVVGNEDVELIKAGGSND